VPVLLDGCPGPFCSANVYQCGAAAQVAELKLENGVLVCDRDAPFNFSPQWSLAPEFRGGGMP
jgi:hypothetical protein